MSRLPDGTGALAVPPLTAAPLSELAGGSRQAFLHARRRALGAVMCCYLFYYTGRQTFGFAIPGIRAELGLSPQQIGWISAAMLWGYAVGQLINGNLGDRFGARRMMFTGALASFVLNWVTSFGAGFTSLLGAWGANGLAQSMGFSPGSRLVANWFDAHERGRAFGMYLLAAGMSSVLAYVTSLVVLDVWGLNWRWIFRLPVALMVLGAVVVWFVARDSPRDAGFSDADAGGAAPGEPAVMDSTIRERYIAALSNGRLLMAAVAIGFQGTVRYSLLIWVPVYFLGADAARGTSAKWITIALPLGMAMGAVANGWISDRFCHGRRSGVIAAFMALAAVAALLMYALPPGHMLGIPVLFVTGFFAYGPHAAFWALAADLMGRSRTGTAVGVMNFFAYAFAGLGEPFVGWMIQRQGLSGPLSAEAVSVVFPTVAAFAACSALVAVMIRR